MLKSMLLNSVRPFYDAEKGQGSEEKKEPTQAEKNAAEREKIGTVNNKEEDVEVEETEGDENIEDEEKESDEGKEDDEKVELTAEQKENEKLKRTIERLQKRVGKTTGEKAQIAKDLAAARTQLDAKVAAGEGLTEEEVERRSEIKANEKVAEREFKKDQSKLIREATSVDKEFMTKVNEMAEEVAPIPSHMIGILADMDNGGAVLAYLANNPDEYEAVFDQSIVKMTRQLDKIGQKIIEEDKTKKEKKISKVPPPNEPIKGNERSPNVLTDKMEMDDWVRTRNQQAKERRENRNR